MPMMASKQDRIMEAIRKYLPITTLLKIPGEPKLEDLILIYKLICTNFSFIPSNLEGGAKTDCSHWRYTHSSTIKKSTWLQSSINL